MKDIFGNELEIGDTVAFMEPGYTYTLQTGTIIKITPQKILIEWWKNKRYNPKEQSYKFPEQVAKGIKNESK